MKEKVLLAAIAEDILYIETYEPVRDSLAMLYFSLYGVFPQI